MKQHVRDHLTDFILVKVSVVRDGSLMASNHWGSPTPPEQWWAKLYVDPKDGLIKRTDKLCRKLGVPHYRDKLRDDRKRRVRGEYVHNLRCLTDTRMLLKLKGCWFQVDTDYPPEDRFGRRLGGRDLVTALSASTTDPEPRWRIIAKHQLSKKELKVQKLCND